MAAKKPQVSDIRAMLEAEAVGIDDMQTRTGRSIHTLLSYTQGRVPRGADPWPEPVKVVGKKTRLYCWTECSQWLDRWAPRD